MGHYRHTTLCDHAADLRAPTPSAAAELVSEESLVLLSLLDEQQARCGQALLRMVDRHRQRLDALADRPCLRRPEAALDRAVQTVDLLSDRLERALGRHREKFHSRLALASARLDALSPLRVLSRGFAAVEDSRGDLVLRASSLSGGERLVLRFCDGRVPVQVAPPGSSSAT